MRIVILLLLLIMVNVPAHAKRSAPKPVPPISYQGVVYSVIHWGFMVGTKQNGGYLRATEEKTGKVLWTIHVYKTANDVSRESDVGDVFITKTTLDKTRQVLLVENEKGEHFEVNLNTQEVIKK